MLDKILVSRYQLIANLSRGAFGSTYLAKDIHLPGNPKCVVKKLNPITSDRNFLEVARRLFQTEAKSLQRLGNHSQIPRLLAYFEEEREFYLVQEFIRGHNLSKELVVGTVWPEKNVIKLLRECLNILDFIHSRNVIHRDIKPDNLICRQLDNKLVLVDFGAVKEVTIQNQGTSKTTIAIGTKGYMPSEQALGKPRFNSDIYSVGIIAIQALTGIEPNKFQQDDDGEIIWGKRGENINSELVKVINKMTRYHFKDRYLSAGEVLRDLDALKPIEGQKNINKFNYQKNDRISFGNPDIIETKTIVVEDKTWFKRLFNPQIYRSKYLSQKPVNKAKLKIALIGSIAACSSLGLGAIYLYNYQKEQRIASLLGLMQLNYQQKEYNLCLENAKIKSPKIGVSVEKIAEFIGKCTLGLAEIKAEENDFIKSIAIAKTIPNNNPFAAEARQKIAQWSQKILARMTQIYDREGNLTEINKIFNNIPE